MNKKTPERKASRCEIIEFADLVQKRMDTDEIKELVRRTPGIEPQERRIAFLRLTSYRYDADIAAAEGVDYSRSSVGRHLARVIPIIRDRYELDQMKAGA